jgi:lipopolysaccharide export system ATP-binding protein
MEGDPRLELVDLVHSFGRRRVLDGLSLGIGPGEVVGLLGPNGAGKTTALKIVMGFEHPQAGDVRLGERLLTGLDVEKRAGLGLGYLPQEPSIFPDLSVRDNLVLVLEALGRASDPVAGLLDDLRIGHLARQKAGELSGGERRRLEIARLLALDARYCLLDEPFTGMDPRSMDRIARVIRDLADQGRAVLVSDHNVRQTLALCDRVTLIDSGKAILTGTSQEVQASPLARERYLGDGFEV